MYRIHLILPAILDLLNITLTATPKTLSTSVIQCNHCHKQYIGETKRRLKDRFNEHRRPADKQTNSSKPTTVSEHFFV